MWATFWLVLGSVLNLSGFCFVRINLSRLCLLFISSQRISASVDVEIWQICMYSGLVVEHRTGN